MIVITHLNIFWAMRKGYIDRCIGPDEMVVVFL